MMVIYQFVLERLKYFLVDGLRGFHAAVSKSLLVHNALVIARGILSVALKDENSPIGRLSILKIQIQNCTEV